MTDEPDLERNDDRARLAEKALGHDPDDAPKSGNPLAKTSSGDAEHVTSDDDSDD